MSETSQARSRSVALIGQAEDILVQRYGIGPRAANDLLVRLSDQYRCSVAAVAQWLVAARREPVLEQRQVQGEGGNIAPPTARPHDRGAIKIVDRALTRC